MVVPALNSDSQLSFNLKTLLKSRNLTISELSKKTGIAQPIIHRIVHGINLNPKIATLVPIARYFSITLTQLIGT